MLIIGDYSSRGVWQVGNMSSCWIAPLMPVCQILLRLAVKNFQSLTKGPKLWFQQVKWIYHGQDMLCLWEKPCIYDLEGWANTQVKSELNLECCNQDMSNLVKNSFEMAQTGFLSLKIHSLAWNGATLVLDIKWTCPHDRITSKILRSAMTTKMAQF